VSGKKGGYQLARPASEIKIGDIIRSVAGPLSTTDCVIHPEICLNSSFCEARMIWVLISDKVSGLLDDYSLADLIRKNWLNEIREQYSEVALLDPDTVLAGNDNENSPGCPVNGNMRGE
jgi:DNA-binding IscR family transcriptional regulator